MSNSILPGALAPDISAFPGLNKGTSSGAKPSGTGGTGGLGDKLGDLQKQIDAARKLAADQAKIQTQDFQKNTRDLKVDTRLTARNVGILRQNDTRLNVFSALDKNDPADFFSFTVSTTAPTKLAALSQDASKPSDVRYQLLNSTGQVVADSDAKAGDAKKAFDQLQQGTFNLKAGKYVLRVTRADDSVSNRNNQFQYAVQLSQGLFKKDFDTIEKSVDPKADPFGLGSNSALDTLTASLAGSVADLQNLPPIGTSATDKLTGALTSFTA